jgi:peptide deformylase
MVEEIVDLEKLAEEAEDKVEVPKDTPPERKTVGYSIGDEKLPLVKREASIPLTYYPAPILGVPSDEVEGIQESDLKQMVAQMVHTMYRNVGIGLAGPQVGFPYRIFVWDAQWPNTKEQKPNVLLNPEITWKSEELQTLREGCLSVALGWHVNVPRAEEVKVKGINLRGEEVSFYVSGIEAACFQHEIDHLDGTLIVDYDGKVRRSLYDKKVVKFARRRKKAFKRTQRQLELAKRTQGKIEAARKRGEERFYVSDDT